MLADHQMVLSLINFYEIILAPRFPAPPGSRSRGVIFYKFCQLLPVVCCAGRATNCPLSLLSLPPLSGVSRHGINETTGVMFDTRTPSQITTLQSSHTHLPRSPLLPLSMMLCCCDAQLNTEHYSSW